MRKLFLALCLLLPSVTLAQTRPAITGIAFMRVYTDDLEAARHFYGPTMGYEEKQGPAGTLVYPINRHQWIEVMPSKTRDGQSYLGAVGFTVSDVAAMKTYLAAKGIAALDSPYPGALDVHDPEGNLIAFVQPGAGGPEADLVAQTALSPRAPS
ncbi:MAG TPA: VOC family protein, partial [Acidobacteriaceae bacterium]|nr:VOC family protein [Acidobacteriaceae bacterium]